MGIFLGATSTSATEEAEMRRDFQAAFVHFENADGKITKDNLKKVIIINIKNSHNYLPNSHKLKSNFLTFLAGHRQLYK